MPVAVWLPPSPHPQPLISSCEHSARKKKIFFRACVCASVCVILCVCNFGCVILCVCNFVLFCVCVILFACAIFCVRVCVYVQHMCVCVCPVPLPLNRTLITLALQRGDFQSQKKRRKKTLLTGKTFFKDKYSPIHSGFQNKTA